MVLNQVRMMLCFVLLVLCLPLLGCNGLGPQLSVVSAVDRSDPQSVSSASFTAILAKDYEQFRRLAVTGNLPSEAEWRNGSFIRDYTPGETIKALWRQGPIRDAALGEPTYEDYQGPLNNPVAPYRYVGQIRPAFSERVVQIPFVLSGQSYLATFVIAQSDGRWSVGLQPVRGDFFVRFQVQ